MEDSDVAFERVLHSIGEDGRFHRRYNLIFNFLVALTGTMVYVNLVMTLTIPEHWCMVPGRENVLDQNITIEEWKNITLPKEVNSYGEETYSSCKMYKTPLTKIVDNVSMNEVTECIYGYEYDKTWYSSTAVTINNWVCENELNVFNILTVNKVVEVIGGICIGVLGDIAGRRPVFFLAFICMMTSRILLLFVAHSFWGFVISSVIGAFPSSSIGQTCLVIIMELSPAEDRATIAQIQYIGWSIGLCLLPLINWILPDWDMYVVATTAPLSIYVFLGIFLIESPKWLLSRGRVSEALNQLKYIAKVNKTRLSVEASLLLQRSKINVEKMYGVFSLFSNWRMAKNTVLLSFVWMTVMISYYTIFLSVISVMGNPFLYFFLQSLAEVPAYLFGRILCDRIGRRFCSMSGLILALISYVVLMLTKNGEQNEALYFSMMMMAKFAICTSFYVVNLQGLEIYPTCVRQSGNSFGITTGNIISSLGPYVLYLGFSVDSRLPFAILSIFAAIAIVSEVFLPETLYERLPETLHDAKIFGQDQEYWSLPHRKTDPCVLANIKLVKRQQSETLRIDE